MPSADRPGVPGPRRAPCGRARGVRALAGGGAPFAGTADSASAMKYVAKIGVPLQDTQLDYPSAVASDGTYLYIADAGDARIVKIRLSDMSFVDVVQRLGRPVVRPGRRHGRTRGGWRVPLRLRLLPHRAPEHGAGRVRLEDVRHVRHRRGSVRLPRGALGRRWVRLRCRSRQPSRGSPEHGAGWVGMGRLRFAGSRCRPVRVADRPDRRSRLGVRGRSREPPHRTLRDDARRDGLDRARERAGPFVRPRGRPGVRGRAGSSRGWAPRSRA